MKKVLICYMVCFVAGCGSLSKKEASVNHVQNTLQNWPDAKLVDPVEEYLNKQIVRERDSIVAALMRCDHLIIKIKNSKITKQIKVVKDEEKIRKFRGAIADSVVRRKIFYYESDPDELYMVIKVVGENGGTLVFFVGTYGTLQFNNKNYDSNYFLFWIAENIFFGENYYDPSDLESVERLEIEVDEKLHQ